MSREPERRFLCTRHVSEDESRLLSLCTRSAPPASPDAVAATSAQMVPKLSMNAAKITTDERVPKSWPMLPEPVQKPDVSAKGCRRPHVDRVNKERSDPRT